MLSGFLLYTLAVSFIVSTYSLALYDEVPEISEGNTATPTPLLRSISNPRHSRIDIDRWNQFIVYGIGKPVRGGPDFVRTAEDRLRNKLLKLLRQSMKDLEVKIKYLESYEAENKETTVDVSDIVDDINRAYRDLTVVYKNIEKHQRTVPPVKILGAYRKLRKSNMVVSTLLSMLSGDKPPMWTSERNEVPAMGIAWSYYDDSLG